jgi:hypothetical protein
MDPRIDLFPEKPLQLGSVGHDINCAAEHDRERLPLNYGARGHDDRKIHGEQDKLRFKHRFDNR